MSYSSYKQKPRKDLETTPIYPLSVQMLIDAYDRNNLAYQLNTEDRDEMRLEDAERQGYGQIQNFVTSVYRVKTDKRFTLNQSFDEALFFYRHRSVLDYSKQPINVSKPFGYLWEPITTPQINARGGVDKYNKVGEKPFFWIPFSPEQVDKILAESLTGVDQFHVGFAAATAPYIINKNELFTIRNIDDFKEGTFTELWDIGRLNYTSTEPCLERWRAEGKDFKKQAKTYKALSNQNLDR
jgi:hypothetical protein